MFYLSYLREIIMFNKSMPHNFYTQFMVGNDCHVPLSLLKGDDEHGPRTFVAMYLWIKY